MENEIGERFLPLGSVVTLKGGKEKVIIVGYSIMSGGQAYNKDGKVDLDERAMFDYGAYIYPMGMGTSDHIYVFNHDQIETLHFKGYVTDEYEEVNKALHLIQEKIKERTEKETPAE